MYADSNLPLIDQGFEYISLLIIYGRKTMTRGLTHEQLKERTNEMLEARRNGAQKSTHTEIVAYRETMTAALNNNYN